MSEAYIGEIRMFGGNFAPQGWAFCDGSLLPIASYDALYNLIGTTYGGDGETTFALPNLCGRLPIHQGQGQGLSPRTLGELGGSEQVTLIQQQIPSHNHIPLANASGGSADTPANNYWSGSTGAPQYTSGDQANTNMNTNAIGAAGGNQPHDNMQPFLVVSFIISLNGIYPTQN